MHYEILSTNQKELLPLIREFKRSYYLVRGTAIALNLGHRKSIDFDLFTAQKINKKKIYGKLNDCKANYRVIYEDYDQIHFIIHGVKFTFFEYPYPIPHPIWLDNTISMPDLLDLAAMKAFALGRRSKWKDYVDLFFFIKYHFSISQISEQAMRYFKQQFSEKLFRQQLAFHHNINNEEEINYLEAPIPEREIKDFLIDKATERF